MSRPTAARTRSLTDEVRAAVESVCDPEYPGVSIAAMGMVEAVRLAEHDAPAQDEGPDAPGWNVVIELVPTVLSCPAFSLICDDVRRTARTVAGVGHVDVRLRTDIVWSTDRMASEATEVLGDTYAIAVQAPGRRPTCPMCGSAAVTERSAFGSSRCRATWWCAECRNPVEVVRS